MGYDVVKIRNNLIMLEYTQETFLFLKEIES